MSTRDAQKHLVLGYEVQSSSSAKGERRVTVQGERIVVVVGGQEHAGTPMSRGRAWLIVAGILLASAGGAALVIWQAKAHGVPLNYVIGALLIVLGVGFTVLNRSVSDEYLRQHFGGDENAARMRRTWRGGWVGVLLGALMIAAQYVLTPPESSPGVLPYRTPYSSPSR